MTGSEWADSRRYIAPGTSPEPGEWRTDRVPYAREIMDTITDAKTEEIVLMMSSQVGKSEILLNAMGYYIDQEPSPILMVQPTVDVAEAFSKERISPTIEYSKHLKDKVMPESKTGRGSSRRSDDTILTKSFTGGYLALVGSNSPAGLASRPIRILLRDEVDRYGETKEGDPMKLSKQRTTNFHNRKIVDVSTPVDKETSKIFKAFKRSDQRRFHIPCPECGALQFLKWGQVKWDKDDAGVGIPDTARYECEHCKGTVTGPGKISNSLLLSGVWIAEAKSKIAGFHINSMYSPWVDLSSLAAEFIEVTRKRDKEGLKEFVNLKLGEPWEDKSQELDYEHIFKRRREYYDADLPDGVLLLTAGVDVQDSYLAVEIVGWGKDKESWGIDYQILMGDPKQPAVWNQLESHLLKNWHFEDNSYLTPACVCIDSGGHNTSEVYEFTKKHELRRWFAIKGVGGDDKPYIGKPVRNNRQNAIRIDIGVNSGKSRIISNIGLEDEGPNYCHFPRDPERGYDEEYFRGLLAEELRYKYVNGRTRTEWVKIYERNEPLDVRNYATAAMEILNPDFDLLATRTEKGNVYLQATTQQRSRRRVISKGIR